MTQDLDLISTRAEMLAEELQHYLHQQFHIAVRIRRVADGRGFRLYQIRQSGNRHLIDLRFIETLPATQRIAGVLVLAPAELIASKVIAYCQRRGQPKSGTDWRDLAMLLLAFPEFKSDSGAVADCLQAAGATPEVFALWRDLVAQEIRPAEDDDEF